MLYVVFTRMPNRSWRNLPRYYGPEALQALAAKMQGGEGEESGRYIEGEGDGKSDSIPAMVDGQEPAALSTGEYVIPAGTVAAMGNGDNKSGAKKLDQMVSGINKQMYGRSKVPQADDRISENIFG